VTTGDRLQRVIDKRFPDHSQAEVARELKVAPGTLSEWLNDKYEPSLESLRHLADKLGCAVASLIGESRAS
jgi:transcriptional regulator with XRE-family HTH domain